LSNKPAIGKLFFSFLRLGVTAFGGPAMVAYIREISVARYKWLDEETFKDGVVLCQSIPGATAMQTAAYVGLRARGISGALASYIGFGLPAFMLMLILASLYAGYHATSGMVPLFEGLHVVVVAIVAHATFSFGKSIVKHSQEAFIAISASFLFWAGVSPFPVIIGAAITGVFLLRQVGLMPPLSPQGSTENGLPIRQLALFLLLLIAGLLALFVIDRKLFQLAVLMLRIDLFAFGGGFASLPLMLHEVVNVKGWMDQKTFMDGIALGQITPGPIVITATFIGYVISGMAGAFVATAAIFTPSFLVLVITMPVFDRLKSSVYFVGATRGIFASFVGLLFFVTLTFALAVPWDSIRIIMGLAALGALVRGVDILYVVLISAVISIFLL
jgi:chromate transporter